MRTPARRFNTIVSVEPEFTAMAWPLLTLTDAKPLPSMVIEPLMTNKVPSLAAQGLAWLQELESKPVAETKVTSGNAYVESRMRRSREAYWATRVGISTFS